MFFGRYEQQGFPHELLPKIVPAGSCVGHVNASITGWPSGVPVYVGLGDVQCAMYSSLKSSHDAGKFYMSSYWLLVGY